MVILENPVIMYTCIVQYNITIFNLLIIIIFIIFYAKLGNLCAAYAFKIIVTSIALSHDLKDRARSCKIILTV